MTVSTQTQNLKTEQDERSLGECINELYELRERKRELTTQFNQLEHLYKAMEQEVLAAMDNQGTELARSSKASASISTQVVPDVTDWDLFYEYLRTTDQLHLLQRRVTTTAWRELHDSGETAPGTQPFTKRSISLRRR